MSWSAMPLLFLFLPFFNARQAFSAEDNALDCRCTTIELQDPVIALVGESSSKRVTLIETFYPENRNYYGLSERCRGSFRSSIDAGICKAPDPARALNFKRLAFDCSFHPQARSRFPFARFEVRWLAKEADLTLLTADRVEAQSHHFFIDQYVPDDIVPSSLKMALDPLNPNKSGISAIVDLNFGISSLMRMGQNYPLKIELGEESFYYFCKLSLMDF